MLKHKQIHIYDDIYMYNIYIQPSSLIVYIISLYKQDTYTQFLKAIYMYKQTRRQNEYRIVQSIYMFLTRGNWKEETRYIMITYSNGN